MTDNDDPTLQLPPKSVSLSVAKANLDVSKVFLTYINSGGNRFKTAAACSLPVDLVDDLARDEGWAEKLGQRNSLAKDESKSSEEINREILRLQAASQAARLKDEIDAVLLHLANLPPEEKLKYLFVQKPGGVKAPTGSFYVELAKAMETCHQAIYRAMGDQLAKRPDAPDEEALIKEQGVTIAASISKLATLTITPNPKK